MQKKDWESVLEAGEVLDRFFPFIRKSIRDIQDVGILNLEKRRNPHIRPANPRSAERNEKAAPRRILFTTRWTRRAG